jgi:hypothetical protein
LGQNSLKEREKIFTKQQVQTAFENMSPIEQAEYLESLVKKKVGK